MAYTGCPSCNLGISMLNIDIVKHHWFYKVQLQNTILYHAIMLAFYMLGYSVTCKTELTVKINRFRFWKVSGLNPESKILKRTS